MLLYGNLTTTDIVLWGRVQTMSVYGGRVKTEGSYGGCVQTRLLLGPFSDSVGAELIPVHKLQNV